MSVTRNADGTYTVNWRELLELGKMGGDILETFDKLKSLQDKQIVVRALTSRLRVAEAEAEEPIASKARKVRLKNRAGLRIVHKADHAV